MNKNCYRIIFNKTRGLMMAVAETVSSRSKSFGAARAGRASCAGVSIWASLRPITVSLLSALGLLWIASNAHAQVIADPNAPASQRPTVGAAANGVPLVDIRTPSAAGVSRNAYKQFDVQRQGAILNNARTNVQTRLGGWVQGNPSLAGGTARAILNEVNSSNPSLLHGYVEVAGNRAQVVIANPAGIACDGCGFINAGRSTLTTGMPIMHNGSLDGFRVEGGSITVSGTGFDDSRSDYTDLIARSVQINAGIWAKQLKVTTGANEVDATNTGTARITGAGAAPAFGIDVATLGGMYADKITLIGTEAGVGVRNAGNIGAAAGNVLITVDGQLENNGQVASVGRTQIDTSDDIRNSGVINAQAGAGLRTPGVLDNGGGLIRSGGALNIDGDRMINADTRGTNQGIEGHSLHIAARAIDNRSGAMRADTTLAITSRGTLDNTQGLMSSAQSLAIRDSDPFGKALRIINTDGTLIANQVLNIDSFGLTGHGDVLSVGDLSVTLTDDYTHTGRLQASGDASLETAGTLTNHSALLAGAALDLKALTIDNEAGGEIVAGQVNATAPGTLTNRGLIDGQNAFIETTTLNNRETGRIYGDHVAIGAITVHNEAEGSAAPVIAARDRLDIGTQTLNNDEGALLFSAGDMAIGGGLDAARHAIGTATAINNLSGSIEALGNLTIDAAALTNKRSTFSTTSVLSTELPTGLELLAYDPALEFSWDIVETDPVNWRDYVRDLYIDHIDSIAGVDMDANYRNQLVSLIDAQLRDVYQDSINVWNLLITKINNERPEWIDAMVTHLSSQTFPLRSYDQRCRDDECDYITYVTRRRTDYKDVVTGTAPSATIRAGGDGNLAIGNLTNRYSTIETGGDLVLVGDTLLNQGAELYLQSDILSTGYTRHWLRSPQSPFSNAGSTSRLLQTVPAVISAGGAMTGSFTGRIDNVAIRENSAPSSPTGTAIAALNISDMGQTAAGAPNSLFSINAANSNRPLIETDPRFAGYRSWLSSDYMLQQLSLDPASIHQRLGDGFYEQQLIRDQVAQLTGRRFLNGYANDEAQYRALLDQGLLYAQQWALVPGVALSAAQMAQLTSDMIWLVEQDITLADGTQRTTLVPQLYVRVRDGDVLSSGALIAADDLQMNVYGNVANSGTIAGRSTVRLSADTIDNIGGSLRAGNLLDVSAAQDLNVASSTNQIVMAQGAQHRVTLNQRNSIAGLYITNADGILVASAGRDFNLDGALVSNSGKNGQTVLSAGRDLNLATVSETSENYARIGRNWSKGNRRADVGSTIQANGDVTLLADRDIDVRAAYVNSTEGALTALAGNDITVTTGTAESHYEGFNKRKKKGAFSSKTKTTYTTRDSQSSLGSTFSGDTISINADRDLRITGSNVVSTQHTQLSAGNNINIEAATDTYASTYLRKEKRSGVFGSGGTGVTIGSQKQSHDNRSVISTAAASTVGSVAGDIFIRAGEAYTQTGSKALAPYGDIDITAERVDIVDARETGHYTQEHKFKRSGLTVAVTNPVISAVQTADQMYRASKQTDDPRMLALAGATTGLAAKDAYDSVKANPGAAGGINVSISVGTSKSHSKSEWTADTAVGSTIAAGGNLDIAATDAGEDSDLTIRGANMTAGNDLTLRADDEINLLAARNSSTQDSDNKSGSASVGVSLGTSGFGVTASASRGKGNTDGKDVSWAETSIDAGGTLTIESGGDTTLKGAVASGEQVIANIGSDFEVESLQDTSTYDSKQHEIGGSVTVGSYFAASANYGKTDINSEFASVAEQSGIKAGDEGFQIDVAGNTALKGAVIASTDKAIQDQRNTLTTGTLTTSNIGNRAKYEADAVSVTLGIASEGGVPNLNGAGIGSDEGTAASVTASAISGGIIDITDNDAQRALTGRDAATTVALLNRDVHVNEAGEAVDHQGNATAQAIAPIFDADKVAREIQAQVQITEAFSQQAHHVINGYAESERAILHEQLKNSVTEEEKRTVQARLDDLLLQERIMNVLIGAVTGTGGSALTKEALSLAANEMRQIMIEDSKKFPGVIDAEGNTLNNLSGQSDGVRDDGKKVGGTRVDLDLLCGTDNSRCAVFPDGTFDLKDGKIQFIAKDDQGNLISLKEFLTTPEGKKMIGPTGGVQGAKGSLFGMPYEAGSWPDKLIESFSGTHDYIGGSLSTLYDEHGNIKRGMTEAERSAYNKWAAVAIVPSAPFAAAELLPPEVWLAISTFLEAAQ